MVFWLIFKRSGFPLGTNPPSETNAILAFAISGTFGAGGISSISGSGSSLSNGSPFTLQSSISMARIAPEFSNDSFLTNPRGIYPSAAALPMGSLFNSLRPSGRHAGQGVLHVHRADTGFNDVTKLSA